MVSDEGESSVRGISLPARGTAIEIAYGAIDFSVDQKARYQYRLLPVDSDWRKPTEQRTVQYARLGPAVYRFEVRTVSTSGVLSTSGAALDFRIMPPIWQSWWFLLLAGSCLASLVYFAHLYRLRQILAVQRIRTRLATDLHDEMGSGLAEIAILAEVTKQNTEPDVEALSAVAERARGLRGAMSDIVWSVDPSLDHLTDLVRRFRQAASSLLGSTHTVEFTAPSEEEMARIDLMPDRRRHLLMLFKEALTNIATHAQASRVSIEVSVDHGSLLVRIADDGCGFSPAAARPGRGLAGMAYRASELDGTVQIDSEPGRGTTICARSPLR
jgi:signal transduction histidine kinase